MKNRSTRDADALLARLPRFADAGAAAYKPGLERISRLLSALGDPQDAFRTIHVAGTNGKGSTASFVAAIASAAGLRTGLHTSPHLLHVTERMRIDGLPAPRDWLADAVHRAGVAVENVGPSYFELTLALSLLYFGEHDVDLAVVEVGMGGRLDATNVLLPAQSVITEIGLDHTEFLGDTIEAVAREKAGIIKMGVPVVTGARPPAADVIYDAARKRDAPFHLVDREIEIRRADVRLRSSTVTLRSPIRTYEKIRVGLAGRHQIRNAATALRSAELAIDVVRQDPQHVVRGMREVRHLSGLRGRLEVLREEPLVVADVAHNADGMSTVLDHLSTCGRLNGRLTVLLGIMRDKDVSAIGRLLGAAAATVRPIAIESERALSPGELAAALQVVEVNVAEPCTVSEGVHAFLSDASHADTLLVTGSHLVVAQLDDAVVRSEMDS